MFLYHPCQVPLGGGELRMVFDAADNGPVEQMPDQSSCGKLLDQNLRGAFHAVNAKS